MLERLLLRLALTAMAMFATASTPSIAATCSQPGETVVADPAGDGPTPETDILDIAIQEVVAGPLAGKIVVTMHVGSLAGAPSGLWAVQWRDATGNNTTTLGMSACEGAASFTYSYETPEGTQSGSPDGGSYTSGGAIEWIVAREKIGSPADGDTFEEIGGVANLWIPLAPLPGCVPQGGLDNAGPGQYTVGSCLVDAPTDRPPVALRLGAPAPNPARAEVSLMLDVPVELMGQAYEVAMFDLSGRRQRTIASGIAVPGRATLRWDLRDARGHRVRPGTYWARITVGAERRVRPILVR